MVTIDLLTLFPDIFTGPLTESIIKRAVEKSLVKINIHNLRDYTNDKHSTADDKPYGGGAGMVMKPEPIFDAVEKLKSPETTLIMMTPQGKKLDQVLVKQLATKKHLLFICGHYEGIDERVREGLKPLEISIGDYILTNGSLASMVLVDAMVRLVPGVVGNPESIENESFNDGFLEHPHYTRPYEYKGYKVPDELVSGDHGKIEKWRKDQSLKRTKKRRPDLLDK